MAASSTNGSRNSDATSIQDLRQLLVDVQLLHFLPRLRDDLQVTQLSHFEYVRCEDLERIGLGRPAARRLLDAAKKRRAATWRKAVLAKLLPGVSGASSLGFTSKKEDLSSVQTPDIPGELTCLIQEKDIVTGRRLGDGSFGVVKEGNWTTTNGSVKKVAVKMLKVDVVAVAGALEDFMREVAAMTQLSHPNLIRLYGVVLGRPLMMVTELAPLGSLLDILRSEDPPSLAASSSHVLQVCSAMMYLESRRCIHRDIAARNIFLASEDTAKLGDFGLTRSLSQSDDCYVMTEPKKVPFPWCAPESLKTKTFSHASDMWMFGVVMWEVYSRGEDPWAGLNGGQILSRVEAGERLPRPLACAPDTYAFMTQCWQLDPAQRPSFTAAYETLVSRAPTVVTARQKCITTGKLGVEVGDAIAVVEGSADDFWWVGVNERTKEVGQFPRCIVDTARPLEPADISSPLHNSFIHTGHGGSDKTWGHPSHIDEMFLRNPLTPSQGDVTPTFPNLSRKLSGQNRKFKHQSLRVKAGNRGGAERLFQYNKLPSTHWPDDLTPTRWVFWSPHTRDGALVEAASTEAQLSRLRSYSASDLRLPSSSQTPHTPTLPTLPSERGSVSSLNDLPTQSPTPPLQPTTLLPQPTYCNVGEDGVPTGLPPPAGEVLVPVRPSPAPPVYKPPPTAAPPASAAGGAAGGDEGDTFDCSDSDSFYDDFSVYESSEQWAPPSSGTALYGNIDVGCDPLYGNQESVEGNTLNGSVNTPRNTEGRAGNLLEDETVNSFAAGVVYDEPPTESVSGSCYGYVPSRALGDSGRNNEDFQPQSSAAFDFNPRMCSQQHSSVVNSTGRIGIPETLAAGTGAGAGTAAGAAGRSSAVDHHTFSEGSRVSQQLQFGTQAEVLQVDLRHQGETYQHTHQSLAITSSGPVTTAGDVPSLSRNSMMPSGQKVSGHSTAAPSHEGGVSDLSWQLSKMWAKSLSQAPSSVPSSPFKSSQVTSRHNPLPAEPTPPLQSRVGDLNNRTVCSVQDNSVRRRYNDGSSCNYSTLPRAHHNDRTADPTTSQPPALNELSSKINPAFLKELEKNLGRDQISANTFMGSFSPEGVPTNSSTVSSLAMSSVDSKSVTSRAMSSNFSECDVLQTRASNSTVFAAQNAASASISQSNIAVRGIPATWDSSSTQFEQRNGSQPKFTPFTDSFTPPVPSTPTATAPSTQPPTALSDLSVESFSKTLGLQARPTLDTRRFFSKNTAHVRPMIQPSHRPMLPAALIHSSASVSSSNFGLPAAVSSGTNLGVTFHTTSITPYPNVVSSSGAVNYGSAPYPNVVSSVGPMNVSGTNPNTSSGGSAASLPSMYPVMAGVPPQVQSVVCSIGSHDSVHKTLTPQELAEFASPPTSSHHQTQQQVLALQQSAFEQQLQQEHQQLFGNPLSPQQLKVRILQLQQQRLQQQQQQYNLQLQNLQQIEQLKLQQQQRQRRQQEGNKMAAVQPTVVLSPQVTVNYNQLVCNSGGAAAAAGTTGGDTAATELVGRVAAVVAGSTVPEARQALHVAGGNYKGAVQYLKVEKLYRLGLADKADCEQILEMNDWNLQRSASALLDKFS
ncbi:Serine-threonine/tyrosine-protein kinase catalytic domain [Trinorchestia longiramus]|nr:Serine-threonine/tyrosine-protein kinase catalytic domain [Trinorchestia longiramus]